MCWVLSSGVGRQLTVHLFHELHTMNQGRPGFSSDLCLKLFKNLQEEISE